MLLLPQAASGGVEDKLAKIPGVLETRVGYTGGEVENPTYRMVCTNQTGHAEAVRVTYDPAQINYETLVRRFFEIHNPTTPESPGAGYWQPISFCCFLSHGRAARNRGTCTRGTEPIRQVPASHRHGNCPRRGFLRGRGVPSEILRKKSVPLTLFPVYKITFDRVCRLRPVIFVLGFWPIRYDKIDSVNAAVFYNR